jgi:hypothetical protein
MTVVELYEKFIDNINIHWLMLEDELKNEILRMGIILEKDNEFYIFDKKILGFKR